MLLRVGGGFFCMLQVPCMDSNGGGVGGGGAFCMLQVSVDEMYQTLGTKNLKIHIL